MLHRSGKLQESCSGKLCCMQLGIRFEDFWIFSPLSLGERHAPDRVGGARIDAVSVICLLIVSAPRLGDHEDFLSRMQKPSSIGIAQRRCTESSSTV